MSQEPVLSWTPVVIPDRVKVGTVTYRITQAETEWHRKQSEDGDTEGRIGSTDNVAAVIYLAPELTGDVLRITLWHEVLHALCAAVMGGPQWDDLGDDGDAREESVVGAWEHPTLAVLRDNPALVRYLVGEAA